MKIGCPHPGLPVPPWRGDKSRHNRKVYVVMEMNSEGFKDIVFMHHDVRYAEQECWLLNNRTGGGMKHHVELSRIHYENN